MSTESGRTTVREKKKKRGSKMTKKAGRKEEKEKKKKGEREKRERKESGQDQHSWVGAVKD